MRLIGYILFGLFLLLVLLFGLNRYADFELFVKQSEQSSDSYSRSPVFYFPETNQLNFNIPSNTSQIRVLLNAELSSPLASSQLNVEYRLFGEDNSILTEDVLFKAANSFNTESPASQRFFTQQGGAIASLTNETLIDIPLGTDKLTLNVSPYALKVAVRIYALEGVEIKKAELEWRRSHPEERKTLVLPHIYPPELIEPLERLNALTTQWRSVGPEGVADIDYYPDFIFSVDKQLDNSVVNLTEGKIYLSQQHFYTNLDFISLAVDQFSCSSVDSQDSDVLLMFIDSVTNELVQKRFNMNSDSAQTMPENVGSIQFSAEDPCYMTLYDKIGKPISVEPSKRSSYILSETQQLEFHLNPNARDLQALKIDARALLVKEPEAAQSVNLRWVILDAYGNTLDQSSETLMLDNSPNEYLVDANSNLQVSEKSIVYILADKHAATIRLSANGGGVLSKVYARPLTLPVRLSVGLDSVKLNTELKNSQIWFALNPIPQDTDAEKILSYWNPKFIQPSQPPNVWTSEWRSLISDSSMISNELFYLTNNIKFEASNHSFVEIPKTIQIFSESAYDSPTVLSDLVYLRDEQQPQPIEIYVNDEKLVDSWLVNKSGSIRLPRLATGAHKLDVRTSGKHRYFINNIATQQGSSAQKVSAVLLQKALELPLTKQSDVEWVTIRYFPKVKLDHKISIELLGEYTTGSRSELTLPIRMLNYSILDIEESSDVFILNQEDKVAYSPITILFPLKSDLALGDYQLRIESSIAQSGYIQAGYLIDEVSGKTIVFTEEDLDESL